MPVSKYTNANGRPRTLGLFYETTDGDKTGVLYTLKDSDHEGYPSLFRLYIECGDPTEYDFALAHLEGWRHWQLLSNAPWFVEYVERWRWELELKLRSGAVKRIIDEAKSEGRAKFQANKFLVDGGWRPPSDKTPVGRPSQERIKQEAERLNEIERQIFEDHERLN